jgi:hypothetical protein
VFLGPASAAIIAVVGADSALAGHSFVSGEALALTSATVTDSFVGALNPGMEVVRVHNASNPSEILGAGTLRAVRASPLSLAVNTSVASAIVVEFASSMS